MPGLLHNLPLSLYGLFSGCSNNDEAVLQETTSDDPLQGVEPNPDFVIPAVQEQQQLEALLTEKAQEYQRLDAIECGRGGQGLFGNTKVEMPYQLYGTVGYYNASDTLIAYEAFIRRRDANQAFENTRYFVDDWLGDNWQILEISRLRVVVMNQCGYEEVLVPDGSVAATDKKVQVEDIRAIIAREQAAVDHEDFGYLIRETATNEGNPIEFYSDGTIKLMTNDSTRNNPIAAIYRYDPEADAYRMYAANGYRSNQILTREALADHFGIEIPTPNTTTEE